MEIQFVRVVPLPVLIQAGVQQDLLFVVAIPLRRRVIAQTLGLLQEQVLQGLVAP